MSVSDLMDKILSLQKKAQRGKNRKIEAERGDIDKRTAYVWANVNPMPSRLLLSRYRALCLFAEFYRRKHMKGAQLCELVVRLHESAMDGFRATPDVLVDDMEGSWPILLEESGTPYGGEGLNSLETKE